MRMVKSGLEEATPWGNFGYISMTILFSIVWMIVLD